jgi:hypothetical protein
MLKRLITKIKLSIKPPKKGEVYAGDPIFFLVGRNVEDVLFGLRNKYGERMWSPIPSFGCFKLVITNDSLKDYYICEAHALCEDVLFREREWKVRSQPRRINKYLFNHMILQGLLKKEKTS